MTVPEVWHDIEVMAICSMSTCKECEKTWDIDHCPKGNVMYDKKEIIRFLNAVRTAINIRQKTAEFNHKDIEMTEEEFADILEWAATYVK